MEISKSSEKDGSGCSFLAIFTYIRNNLITLNNLNKLWLNIKRTFTKALLWGLLNLVVSSPSSPSRLSSMWTKSVLHKPSILSISSLDPIKVFPVHTSSINLWKQVQFRQLILGVHSNLCTSTPLGTPNLSLFFRGSCMLEKFKPGHENGCHFSEVFVSL